MTRNKMPMKVFFSAILAGLFLVGAILPAFRIGHKGNDVCNYYPRFSADAPILVDGDGGWASIPDISGDGSSGNPYVVKDKIIDAGGVENCILIQNTSKYFIIRNCSVTHSAPMPAAGICILNATNGQVERNNCNANGGGIFVGAKSANVTITQNYATGNEYGIIIYDSTGNVTAVINNASGNTYNGIDVSTDCTDIHVENNLVVGNGIQGISLWDNVTLSTVTGNNASGNTFEGLYIFNTFNTTFVDNLVLGNQFRGVIISDGAGNNTFSNNSIANNLGAGIEAFSSSRNNTFIANNITNNIGVGVILNTGCNGNLLYLNRFASNGAGNARDDAVFNHWDNGSIGNYWQNYTGIDDDDDGIGDAKWLIPGSAGTYDEFPLWRDTNHPLHIVGNNGWAACLSAGNCSGSGTEVDPYVLKGRWYDAKGVTSGIWIENSSVFFLIRNCLANGSAAWPHAGIRISNATNGILDLNNCSKNSGPGIYLENNCSALSLINNYARQNPYGILSMYNSTQIDFVNNTITASSIMGVVLSDDQCNISFFGNNFSYNTGSGLRLVNRCINITIRDNTFSYNTMEGVYLSDCNFTIIEENTLSKNQIGASLDTSAQINRLHNNFVFNNFRGIYSRASRNNTVAENYVLNNTGDGIYFDWGTANDTITANIIVQNLNGIVFATGANINHTFFNNNVINNSQYGMRVRVGGDGNLFCNNSFCDNGQANASDEAAFNHWDNGSVGNIYGDYSGVDLDDDCIGDTEYILNGSAGAVDHCPIFNDGDDVAPVLSVISPLFNQANSLAPPVFEITVHDLTLAKTGYTLNYINTTFTGTVGVIDLGIWNTLLNGTYTLTFFANDSFNRWTIVPMSIQKDIEAPSFISTGLTNGQLCGNFTPGFGLDVNEGNPSGKWWFSFDNGITNISCSQSGFLTGWDMLPNGTVTVQFFTNDTANNVGWFNLELQRDCAPPIITSTGLSAEESYISAPVIAFTINESHLDTIWYSVDGGVVNRSVGGLIGSIDPSIWASLTNGNVAVTFWCNDTLGNTASITVVIVKGSSNECEGCGTMTWYWIISGVIGVGIAVMIAVVVKKRKNRPFYPNEALIK